MTIDKKKITNMLILLFESKMKSYTKTTIDAWFYLLIKYPEEKIIRAIEKVALDPCDFINVGKIVEQIELQEKTLSEIMFAKMVAKKAEEDNPKGWDKR